MFNGKTIKEIYFLYHNINYTITQDLNPAHTYTPSKLGRVGYIYRWGEYELFFYPYRLGKAEYEKNPTVVGFFVSPMQCSEEGAPRYGDLFFAVFNCRAQNIAQNRAGIGLVREFFDRLFFQCHLQMTD